MPSPRAAALAAGCLALLPALAFAQAGQRRPFSPGLVLNTPGRTAACDVLLFTRDGKELLAAGDDKVVRVWPVARGKLTTDPALGARSLRWRIFREKRGSIYAMALSPDESLVVVGGLGIIEGEITVLDRKTGAVRHALEIDPGSAGADNFAVRALLFSPDGKKVVVGKEDGSLWLWTLGKKHAVKVGRRDPRAEGELNQVRLLAWLDRDGAKLLCVTDDGGLTHWDVDPEGKGTPAFTAALMKETTLRVNAAALSPDGSRLAVGLAGTRDRVLTLRDGKGREVAELPLPGDDDLPVSLAFSRDGKRLACGAATVARGQGFHRETGAAACVFDLGAKKPARLVALKMPPQPEAVAFSPDGTHLAVAGGNDNEVTVWDWAKGEQVSQVAGPGRGVWQVGVDKRARTLGFRTDRDLAAKHPNQRGKGDWQTFDLHYRTMGERTADFEPVQPLAELGGWKVNLVAPMRWRVRDPSGKEFQLPTTPAVDEILNCYSFLRPAAKGGPVRLVVGHYSGWTLFELTEGKPPVRVRRARGHASQVMAIAPLVDNRGSPVGLVTGSRDQTIAGWSLASWDNQRELGATFDQGDSGLTVKAVASGSPAWEAGLEPGQQVAQFYLSGKLVYAEKGKAGGLKEAAKVLRDPPPGLQLAFRVRQKQGPLQLKTTFCWQRPVWQFFAARDGEWVLWRSRDFFYDASPHGARYLGWQVNDRDPARTPAFFSADQRSAKFHDPARVERAVKDLRLAAEKVVLPELLPPSLSVEATPAEVKEGGTVEVSVALGALPAGIEAKPRRVQLWLDDRLIEEFDDVPADFSKKVTLKAADLRGGDNVFVAQAFDDAGDRFARATATVTADPGKRKRNLYALVVGIDDYGKSRVTDSTKKERALPSLKHGQADARAVGVLLAKLKGKLYDDATVTEALGAKATRETVTEAIDAVAKKAGPNDLFVFFFAGHAHAEASEEHSWVPGSSRLALSNYDEEAAARTALRTKDLAERMARIACPKVVLLDLRSNGNADVRLDLAREGVGPVILTGTDRGETGQEHEKIGHGLFTRALLDALGKLAGDAQARKRGFAPPALLHTRLNSGLKRLSLDLEVERQSPQKFIMDPEPQLARR